MAKKINRPMIGDVVHPTHSPGQVCKVIGFKMVPVLEIIECPVLPGLVGKIVENFPWSHFDWSLEENQGNPRRK